MKEKYEKPDVALDEFEAMDVLTASGGGGSSPWGGEAVDGPEFPDMG